MSLRKSGEVYIIGELLPEDRAVLVRRVRRLKQAELQAALNVFGGSDGRNVAFADGLVIVGDQVEVLASVAQMLDDVEATEVPVWVVELNLVSWSRRAVDDFGIDLTPAANIALGFAVGSSGVTANADLGASLDGILKLAAGRDDVRVSAAPMFLLVDGSQGKVVQGDRVPVPRRSTSDQGTTVTEGYDYVQTGTNVLVTLREMAPQKALLDISVGISDIRGYVEVAPITGEQTFNTTAMVHAGGVYLLGSIVRDRESSDDSIGWRTADAWERQVQVVQIWCRCHRIAGPLSTSQVQRQSQSTRGLLNELTTPGELQPPAESPAEREASQPINEAPPALIETVYSRMKRQQR